METTAGDGVTLWWEATGAGDPVLLVPGRGDATDLYPARFTDALVEAGFTVIRYDPRDTGRSSDGGDTYTMSDLADDALAVLDAARLPAAHVVGFSMGGLLVSDLAVRVPARVRSLTLMSAASPDPEAGMGEDFFLMGDVDAATAYVRAMGETTDGDRAWVASEVAAAERRAPSRPDAAERHQAAVFRSAWLAQERLGDVAVPCLVFHGTADRTLPLRHGESYASLVPDAELVVMDGMGHLPRPAEWDVIAERTVAHLRD